jgi:hypothetical protein
MFAAEKTEPYRNQELPAIGSKLSGIECSPRAVDWQGGFPSQIITGWQGVWDPEVDANVVIRGTNEDARCRRNVEGTRRYTGS